MNPKTPKRIATLFVLATLTPLAAFAQQQQQPPRPDFGGMARALGVTENAIKTCMPAPAKGQLPERPDPVRIASCLSDANPALTPAKVDDVLKAHGPKGSRGN
ncbi:hypothetical protein [Sulfitobacter sp.]|uniref:hypothetical protein n=1 Tax=Sulfitobacter sp. TaxID=1903071 RepID=UPI0030018166